MIIQVSQKIFMANDKKRLHPEIELIRAKDLYHTCSRFIAKDKEIYICDIVKFNYNNGEYYCSNEECNKKLSWENVMADSQGTGFEGHA